MKPSHNRFARLLSLSAITLFGTHSAQAAQLYWDLNGATANSGNSATGAWNGTNAFWNTASSGTGGTAQAGTTNADDLIFSSGSGYTAGGIITLSGTRVASSITFEENEAYTLQSGTSLTLGGSGLSNGIFLLSGANQAVGVSTALILNGNNTFQTAGTNVLTISGGVTGAGDLILNNNSTNANGITISTGSLNHTGTVTNSGSGSGGVTISSVIGTNVTGVVQNSATSSLTLSGANLYTGLTDVQAGTLTLGANNIFADTSTLKVSGGILSQNTRADTVAGVQLTAGSITGTTGVLTSTTAFDLQAGSASAILGGSVGVNKTTAGTVTLSGANSYTGATSVSDGVLNIQNGSALGTVAGATTVSSGAALEIQGGITTLAEGLTLNGTGIANGGALRNISGTNTYAGAITLNSASRINSDAGTLNLNVASGNAITATNVDVTFGGAGAVTVSDPIATGSGNLTKDGAGTLTLSATNTYTGLTDVQVGTLALGAGNVFANASTLKISGGILSLVANSDTVAGVQLTAGSITGTTGVLTSTTAFDLQAGSASAILGGSVGVNKTTAGTVTLSGANTYTGATSVSDGVLNIQNSNALGTVAGATTVSSGAALEIQGGITTLAEGLTLNGTGIANGGALRNISGTNTYAGAITLNSASRINSDAGTLNLNVASGNAITATNVDVTFGGAGAVTVSDAIATGNGSLTKDGNGVLTLSATNTYTGLTDVQAGTLTLGANNIFADTSTLKVSGGILSQNTRADTVAGVQLTAGSITGTTGVLTSTTAFDLQAGSASAILGGSVGVNKTTAGTVTLSGTNTYTGATAISNGVLNIQNANALGTIAGATTVSSGAALEIQNGITTLAEGLTLNGSGILNGGALRNISGTNTYAGAITLNSASRINSDAGTLNLNVASGNAIAGTNQNVTFGGSGNVTVADAISIGSGSLTKDGAGTLTLSVANTYTGGTTINDGVVNFTVAGAVGGTGANVNVNSGGTAAAGFAINQAFLDRIAGTSSGVVALGLNSANALNFNTAGLTAARLGASGTFTYSGTLTPNGTTYRVGGGGGALTISTALTGAGNSLNMGLGGTSGGTVTLTAANSYGGATVIDEGTLTLSGANGAIASSSGVTINSGGTLILDNTTSNTNRIGAVTLSLKGGTFDFSHPTTGGGTYSEVVGQLLVDSGASTVNSDVVTGAGSSSLLTFASLARTTGATLDFTGAPSAASNDNNVRFTAAPTLVNSIIGGYATVGGTGWATYTGGGTPSVETLGTYVTTATNGNTAASYANDNLDVTTSQAPDAVITPNSIRFNNGTARTLTLQGTTNTITSGGILVTAAATNGGTITGGTLRGASGTDLVVHQYSAGAFSIDSIIADNTTATGLTKSGTGNLTLGGTNSYTGTTTVNAGTLILSGGAAIADTGAVTLANAAGAGLQLNASETIGSLSGGGLKGGNVALGANTLTVGDANSTSFDGVISGTSGGNLVKQGAGTLTLGGTNTYTGQTIINGGILGLDGSGSIDNSSGVVLNNGNFNVSAVSGGYTIASLAGNGSVTGDLTVSGALGIGASPGVITFNNDLTLGSSSVSNFEISLGFASYDLATSGLGSQAVNFDGALNLLFASGFSTVGSVKIFDFETYTGNFSSLVATGLSSGYTATFDQTTGIVNVVPEPGAALLGGLGTLLLLRRRREA